MGRILIGKIGDSDAKKAAKEAALKTQIENEVLARLVGTVPTHNYDGDTYGVRFTNGSTTGVGIGGLTGCTFASFNNDGTINWGTMYSSGFLDVDEVVEVQELVGTNVFESDGETPMKSHYSKFKARATKLFIWEDDQQNKYYDYLILKQPNYEKNFFLHKAFVNDDGTEKAYMLYARFPLAEKTDSDGNKHLVSQPNLYPVSEVLPETAIIPYRDADAEVVRVEWDYIAFLSKIVFGTTEIGYHGYNHGGLLGNALDNYGGYQLSLNSNSAGNTFKVANESPYADLAVGAKVSFRFGNLYGSFGTGGSTYMVTRTITEKEVGSSNTVFTFDGEAINVYNKYLHTVFMGMTGVTESMNALCGEDIKYPAGYRPFKLWGIENLFGAMGTWCDGLKSSNATTLCICDTNRGCTAGSYSGYVSIGQSLPSSNGYIKSYIMAHNSKYDGTVIPRYNFLVPNEVGASNITYESSYKYLDTNNNMAIVYGRDRADSNYQNNGGISSLASSSGNGNAWSNVASSYLAYGCWGRVYRSVE